MTLLKRVNSATQYVMKFKTYLLVMFGLIAVACSPQLLAAECKLVKYSSHENYPPFHWFHNGQFYGVTHDITKKLLTSYGIKHQVQPPQPWKRVLLSARRGKIGLVLGLKNVIEREQYLSFTSAPLLNNPVAVFVKKNKRFPLQGWHSLLGLTGNMNLGDRHGTEFDSFAEDHLKIQRVKGLSANFEMLLLDRADFFITGYYTGQGYLEVNKLDDDIVAMQPYLVDGLIHFGFVKSSPCIELKRRFDKDLIRMINSTEFEQMLKRNVLLWNKQQNPFVVNGP